MKKRKLGDADPTFKVLPSAKRGHPLLIGETMDNQPNIESVRDAGGPITTLIVMTVGQLLFVSLMLICWQKTMVLYLLLQTGLNPFYIA